MVYTWSKHTPTPFTSIIDDIRRGQSNFALNKKWKGPSVKMRACVTRITAIVTEVKYCNYSGTLQNELKVMVKFHLSY